MTVWGAVLIAGFCGMAFFLVEIAPRMSRRRGGDGGPVAPPETDHQHVPTEKGPHRS
ncbi:hypothetical protein [Streptomyces sp. S1]|uniref:hypothetical protein n=1 Tax=Streptomyces sp. S1 TaxID=718288 RepID=UPI003D75F630